MKHILLLSSFAAFASACPNAYTTSVDGLAGGAIKGDVAVEGFSAGNTSTDDLAVAGELTVQGAASLATATATNIEATEVEAATVKSDQIIHHGFALFGTPLGKASYDRAHGDAQGYRGADAKCAAAYGSAAHVCSAEEAMTAYRAGVDLALEFDRAAVNTYIFATALQLRSQPADANNDSYLITDDCDGWRDSNSLISSGGSNPFTDGDLGPAYGFGHTYAAVRYDQTLELWRIAPVATAQNCNGAVPLLCCG